MTPQKLVSPGEKMSSEEKYKHSCALCPYSTRHVNYYKQHLVTHSKNKPFKCPECPHRSKLKGDLKVHVKLVHLLKSPSAPRPFPCSYSGCNYAAKQKNDLIRHSKIHSDENPEFSCPHSNCNYSTNRKGSLAVHIRIHTGEKPFVCQFGSCSYASTNQSHLVSHSRTHTKERPYKCPEPNCKYSTGLNSALKVHRLTHHPIEGAESPTFSCPLCEFSTKYKSNLSVHIKTHTLEKLFKCDAPTCSFKARTKSEIEGHKVVHSDEKPFACSFESCEFRCKFKKGLDNHFKIHSAERLYKCELCPYRGKTRSVVTNHLKNIHSDPHFRPFKCPQPQCDYASKAKGHLKKHLLSHQRGKKHSPSPA